MCAFLLRKRWRHGGEGHQRLSHGRLGHLLLWVKGELRWGWRLDHAVLHGPRLASKLLILEILSPERSSGVGLSVVVASAATSTTKRVAPRAIETAIGAVAPSILSIVAKGFLWSVVIPPVVVAVPEAAVVSPAAAVAIMPTSASRAATN